MRSATCWNSAGQARPWGWPAGWQAPPQGTFHHRRHRTHLCICFEYVFVFPLDTYYIYVYYYLSKMCMYVYLWLHPKELSPIGAILPIFFASNMSRCPVTHVTRLLLQHLLQHLSYIPILRDMCALLLDLLLVTDFLGYEWSLSQKKLISPLAFINNQSKIICLLKFTAYLMHHKCFSF